MEDAHIGVLNLQQQSERRLGLESSKAQAFFGVLTCLTLWRVVTYAHPPSMRLPGQSGGSDVPHADSGV